MLLIDIFFLIKIVIIFVTLFLIIIIIISGKKGIITLTQKKEINHSNNINILMNLIYILFLLFHYWNNLIFLNLKKYLYSKYLKYFYLIYLV